MVHTSDVYPFIKTKLRPKRSGRKNLSSSFVMQNPRYKFKRETFVQSIFMMFFFGNLTDKRADVDHLLYDTTSLSN